MISSFLNLQELLDQYDIEFNKNGVKDTIQSYNFHLISPSKSLKENELEKLDHYVKKSKIIIIYQNKDLNEETQEDFLLIGFEKTLIILNQTSISFLTNILTKHTDLSVCFLNDTKNIIQKKIKNHEIEIDENFIEEINSLQRIFLPKNKNKNKSKIISRVLTYISPCISAYLIKKSYLQNKKYRIEKFIKSLDENSSQETMNEQDYVELRSIGKGTIFECKLIYHIKRSELYAIKKPYQIHSENRKLLDREAENYLKVRHPFLPKFYGKVLNKDYIVIDFINGQTLDSIEKIELTYNEKITVIFELMLVIKYLHNNKFIHRDLKPNNVMIDENKTLVLIDLDRLSDKIGDPNQSLDLGGGYADPSVCEASPFSYESDIYSLGELIKRIMKKEFAIFDANSNKFKDICAKCTCPNIKKRPSISDVIVDFLSIFQFDVQIELLSAEFKDHFFNFEMINNIPKRNELIYNDTQIQLFLGMVYLLGKYVTIDIQKAIHFFLLSANLNNSQAQFYLGLIYSSEEFNNFDIEKAISYYTFASKQNNVKAQFNLGQIFSTGKYMKQDIKKAIYYFTLAANQNHQGAQFNLGHIYSSGEYTKRDINRGIYYYTLAASQNNLEAQYNLGFLYADGKYVEKDINKAIYYFTLAANQNDVGAQFGLGLIYQKREDIGKALYYFTQAANQNHPKAQFYLGVIYLSQNINKAIYYFTLAANQNDEDAQFNLGYIYESGKYVSRDINKAIHYYSLAANQNNVNAQFNLGVIYAQGLYVVKDINKAIYYYFQAANQKDANAQFMLGFNYSNKRYDIFDINKAIHYYSLSAEQNNKSAQFCLGLIYFTGEHVTLDIEKAIHYFMLAANQNDSQAQFYLGQIFSSNNYSKFDINKAIYYYSHAAYKNHPEAQFMLGLIYYLSDYLTENIKKGRLYIMLASKNGNKKSNFAHAFMLHEGKIVKKDMNEAIRLYKEASSFNIQYAKNNLGVINKNGCDGIKKNLGAAIDYFSEAIRQKDDYLSMYNLAHLYIYEEEVTSNINKIIDLLIKSSIQFNHSLILLCLVLIKKFDFNIEMINKEIEKRNDKATNLTTKIYRMIYNLNLFERSVFHNFYENYSTKDFFYNIHLNAIQSIELQNINPNKVTPIYPNAKNISSEFYNGFGYDLLND